MSHIKRSSHSDLKPNLDPNLKMRPTQHRSIIDSVWSVITLLIALRTPKDPCTSLLESPTNLNIFSIVLVILIFVGRTIKHSLGLGTAFTPLSRLDEERDDDDGEELFALPSISLICPLDISRDCGELFHRCLRPHPHEHQQHGHHGESPTSPMGPSPALVSLFLASLSEPAMLLLLCRPVCPIRPLGAVNVRNRFEVLDWAACRDLLLETEMEGNRRREERKPGVVVTARFVGPATKVKRGLEVGVEVVVSSATGAGEGDRRGVRKDIFRQVFTFLQFVTWKGKGKEKKKIPVTDPRASVKVSTNIGSNQFDVEIPATAPNLWARLCKDYNPIHLSSIAARAFGFPGKIAHGNHVVAISVRQMLNLVNGDGGGQDDSGFIGEGRDGWCMEVDFKRPVVLPATVTVAVGDSITDATMMDGEKRGEQRLEILDAKKKEKVLIEVSCFHV